MPETGRTKLPSNPKKKRSPKPTEQDTLLIHEETRPSNEERTAPPLEFITLTEKPSSQKNEFSYRVRSHAMQAFVHRKKNPQSETSGTSTSHRPDASTPKDLSGRFKLSTWSRKSRKKISRTPKSKEASASPQLPNVVTTVQSQVTSPLSYYGSIPILSNTLQTRRLLHHYNTAFVSNAFVINFDETWKPFSILDPAILHATLGLVAQHEDLLLAREDSPESLDHKGEVMRLINQRLQTKEHWISDTDVASVSLLVILESINGTLEAASAHRVGLLRMVRVRGGILSFVDSVTVLRVLAWADIVYSTRFGLSLEMPSPFSANDLLTSNFSYSLHDEHDLHTIPSVQDSQGIATLCTLRMISNSIDLPNLTIQQKKYISSALYATEYNTLQTEHRQSSSLSTRSLISQVVTLSSIIYLQIAIRLLPTRSKVHLRLLSKILLMLQSLSPFNHRDEKSKDLLLWVVFVCASASAEREVLAEFILTLNRLDPAVDKQEKDEIRGRLERVVWRDRICRPQFESIWDLVAAKRAVNDNVQELVVELTDGMHGEFETSPDHLYYPSITQRPMNTEFN